MQEPDKDGMYIQTATMLMNGFGWSLEDVIPSPTRRSQLFSATTNVHTGSRHMYTDMRNNISVRPFNPTSGKSSHFSKQFLQQEMRRQSPFNVQSSQSKQALEMEETIPQQSQ